MKTGLTTIRPTKSATNYRSYQTNFRPTANRHSCLPNPPRVRPTMMAEEPVGAPNFLRTAEASRE